MISKHFVHRKVSTRKPSGRRSQVAVLFWPSTFHCGFQVLISGIFPFVRKQYKVFSIHFKISLPVTFTSIACWQVQAGGIGMETFRWAGWRDKAKKKKGWEAGWTKLMLDPHCGKWVLFMWTEKGFDPLIHYFNPSAC